MKQDEIIYMSEPYRGLTLLLGIFLKYIHKTKMLN